MRRRRRSLTCQPAIMFLRKLDYNSRLMDRYLAVAALFIVIGCSSSSSTVGGPDGSTSVDGGGLDGGVDASADGQMSDVIVPPCVGTATSCSGASQAACSRVQGCEWGCYGNPCPALGPENCDPTLDCFASNDTCECLILPNCCGNVQDQATCQGYGCTWNDFCFGTEVPCSGLVGPACVKQPGCYLAGTEPDSGLDSGDNDDASDAGGADADSSFDE